MLAASLLHDIRAAYRSLLEAPALTFVVLTLTVATGASTVMLSVVESLSPDPLPYPNEDRIVRVAVPVHESTGSRGDRGNTFSDRGHWHFLNNNRSFEKFGYPELGRLRTPRGERAERPAVALLSHQIRMSRYGADPAIIGCTPGLNGTPGGGRI